MIRVYKSGDHAHRTPLSYPALAELFAPTITLVDHPAQADIYVFGHILDVQNAPETVVRDWRARQVPVVILSEEPFWDTIWGKEPLTPLIYPETAFGPLPVVQINHQTSDLFQFDRIPYYLLTHPRFQDMYTTRFARNAARTAAEWAAHFAQAANDTLFMFERRPEAYHAVRWPAGDLEGLCSWRTELAEAAQWDGVQRLGHSWQGGKTRFQLEDWYGDKMAGLDGQARKIGALENTHQPHYVTEKLFDAFANGALPLYYASPGHRVHDFGLPADSWINLYELSPTEAAEVVRDVTLDAERIAAFQAAQSRLHTLMGDAGIWAREKARLGREVPRVLAAVLDSPPAAA